MAYAIQKGGTWWVGFLSRSGQRIERRVGPVVSWRRWQVERLAEELRQIEQRLVEGVTP